MPAGFDVRQGDLKRLCETPRFRLIRACCNPVVVGSVPLPVPVLVWLVLVVCIHSLQLTTRGSGESELCRSLEAERATRLTHAVHFASLSRLCDVKSSWTIGVALPLLLVAATQLPYVCLRTAAKAA